MRAARTIERLRWPVAVALTIGVLLGTWAVGMPRFAAPDEVAHTIKAYATAHGEALGVPIPGHSPFNRAMLSPNDLASDDQACFALQPDQTAACAVPSSDPALSRHETTASTYPPAYYFVVGLATRVAGADRSLRAYRAVSILLVAAILAWSAACMARVGRGRPALLLLALSPMAVYMTMAVNPTAVEISGTLLLWAYLTMLLVAARPATRRHLLTASWIGAAVVVVRPVSMAWVAVAIGVFLVLERRPLASDRRALTRTMAVASIPLVVAVAASVAWGRYAGVGLADDKFRAPGGVVDHLRVSVGHTSELLRQAIGLLGWVDTPVPFVAYAVVGLWWLAIVGMCLQHGDRRTRTAIVSCVAILIAYPVVYTTLGRTPLNWNGRYDLPVLGVLVLVSAWVARDRLPEPTFARWATVLGCSFVVVESLAFHQALRRFMVGRHGDILLRGASWHPAIGAWPLLAVNVLAAVALAVLLLRSPTTPVDVDHSPDVAVPAHRRRDRQGLSGGCP